LPKIDQAQVYEQGYKVLKNNGVFAIFPEGGSHDRTDLLPLKAGPAIFCLGSMKEYNLETKMLCVGLNYDKPHKFRSIAIAEFSHEYSVSKDDFAKYKIDRREITGKVLEDVTNLMRDVKLRAPNYEQMLNYHLIRQIYVDKFPMEEGAKLLIERRFAENIEKAKNFEDVQMMLENVDVYRQGIKGLGISDWQLREPMNKGFVENTIALWRSIFIVLITITVGLPGLVFIWPFKVYIETLAETKRQQALAKSSVKIKANDVVASWKILIGCALFPVYYFIITLVWFIVRSHKYADGYCSRFAWTQFWGALFLIYLAITIKVSDSLLYNLRIISMRTFYVLYKQKVQSLIEIRSILQNQVYELSEKYGNMYIDNYDKKR